MQDNNFKFQAYLSEQQAHLSSNQALDPLAPGKNSMDDDDIERYLPKDPKFEEIENVL